MYLLLFKIYYNGVCIIVRKSVLKDVSVLTYFKIVYSRKFKIIVDYQIADV